MKKIILLIAPVILLVWAFHPIHSLTITGKITDEKGSPISNVTISLKGAHEGVLSGTDGSYTITVQSGIGTLTYSAQGYKMGEEKIKGRSRIDVTLHSSTDLEEVITVTKGVGAKNDISGAIKLRGLATKSNRLYTSPTVSQDGMNSQPSDEYMKRGFVENNNDEKEEDFNTEGYDHITENRFLKVNDNPLSTFSIDVDAASYSNVRRFLNQGQLPPAGAVRIEEMINYFHYEYPQPSNDQPFSINTEIADCPWNKENKLVLIGLQGKKISTENLPSSNIVFLIDVSGSMDEPLKLPLVKTSMKMLVDQLREQDKIALVVYAGNAGLVLPSTSGADKTKIKDAIDRLEAGGSTAGGAGIQLAYKIAKQNFMKNGNNRVILCTDGDFNIGASSDDQMESLIEEERKSGVFLTVLGFGMGNYKDSKMQKLADKGNGNHAYIDGLSEAKKVLVSEFGGTLFTIAKDVKLQIEFNPEKVEGYRLIGYENRILNKEDFNNDKKDAGDLGSGHTVTALYEVIPAGVKSHFLETVDPLKYQQNNYHAKRLSATNDIMTVKFRYKAPDGDVSKLIEHPVIDQHLSLAQTSDNFRFAASVAEFGMLLRNSEFKSDANYEEVVTNARRAKGKDEEGYRAEFVHLVENAQALAKNTKPLPVEEDVRKENKVSKGQK